MKKKVLAVVLSAITIITLVGCASKAAGDNQYAYGGSSSAPSASGGGAPDRYPVAEEYEYGMTDSSMYYDASDSLATNISSQAITDGLKIIYSADISVQTKEWEKSMERLAELIEIHGGYIQNSRVSGGYTSTTGYYRDFSAYLSIRIPSSEYRLFISDTESVGTIIDMNEYTDDITAAYIDTEARIKSLKLQEERLLDLLSKAGDLTDLIEIESKLADVRYQIESNQSIMNTYNNLLSFSTINISLNEVSEYVIPKDTFGERVVAALKGSGEAVLKFLDGLVVALIYMAPYIIIALIILFIVRRLTRKKRLARKAEKEARRNNPPPNMVPAQYGGFNMPNPYNGNIQQPAPESQEPPQQGR
ncbi:MAG: DUF4349 domain-containing protein [Oscillospiraceae bacterium]|nr:DUF4349 domain-containing protein [Oscillospiraceae bacterium]